MAYATLSSLLHTLKQLLQSKSPLICGSSIQQQHVESIYQSLCALQVFLEDTTREAKDIEILKVIEKRIRDVVYKAEDRVDSSLRSVILEDNGDDRETACRSFNEELQEVEKEVNSLKKEVMQIDFNKRGSKSAEATTTSSSRRYATEHNTIVGMEDDFNSIIYRFTNQIDELTVIPIVGMDGIVSTILAGERKANGRVKSCKIHDLLRQLCIRESQIENVVHVKNKNVRIFPEQERLVMLQFDFHDKNEYCHRHGSGIISTIRSLVFTLSLTGFKPFSIYKRRGSIISYFVLLNVLDSSTINYDFSDIIHVLVHLR
ncbi:hypothetical protein K7X08_030689 [Anisodus acutangulus]|uniref:Disease resistance N-terminal domain-containing protein n=1 Tax=Anisodus acutangulus TaxID=402998 RepID=A0A9Q1M192_9SOLA|nr:hypothetical protein K7X08_030689 [Anisodus acutangulus]